MATPRKSCATLDPTINNLVALLSNALSSIIFFSVELGGARVPPIVL